MTDAFDAKRRGKEKTKKRKERQSGKIVLPEAAVAAVEVVPDPALDRVAEEEAAGLVVLEGEVVTEAQVAFGTMLRSMVGRQRAEAADEAELQAFEAEHGPLPWEWDDRRDRFAATCTRWSAPSRWSTQATRAARAAPISSCVAPMT